MRYAIYKIEPSLSYLITIGSRDKPDSEFRERVQSDINRAMGAFSRERGSSHALAIVTDSNSAESGEESTIPELFPGGQYLIFALFSSGEISAEFREELSGNQTELEGAFRRLLGEDNPSDISIGLVLLRDCSVKLIPAYAPSGPGYRKGWIKSMPEETAREWLKR